MPIPQPVQPRFTPPLVAPDRAPPCDANSADGPTPANHSTPRVGYPAMQIPRVNPSSPFSWVGPGPPAMPIPQTAQPRLTIPLVIPDRALLRCQFCRRSNPGSLFL